MFIFLKNINEFGYEVLPQIQWGFYIICNIIFLKYEKLNFGFGWVMVDLYDNSSFIDEKTWVRVITQSKWQNWDVNLVSLTFQVCPLNQYTILPSFILCD